MTSNQDLIRAVTFAHSQVKRMAVSDPDEIAPAINSSLTDLFRHAKKLKFWHERLKSISEDVSVESLSQSVPILTRPEIQESSGLLRLRIPDTKKSDYYTSKTSGSTGQPVEVLKFTPSQRIQNGVITLLRQEWGKLDITKNHARIRNGRDERSSESWGFPYTLLGKTGKSFTMDMETRRASGVLNEILDKEISYIQANTTLLKALAFEAYSEGITENLGLQKGLTWAEKVTDEDRSVVRDYLGVEIWDSYSSEELGAIALQCPEHNHLHTLPFFTLIEIVDEDGRPCPVGEVGRVIATSLHNFAQPMIRYELGDLASFQDQCDALPGLPVINPEVTRVRDIYIDKNGVEYVPRFGKCRFVTYRGIRDYQVVVCSDAILFMYSATTKFLGNQELEISEDVGKQFGFDLPVQVQRIQDSEMFSHWKRKVFYRSNASHVEFQKPENLANLKGLLQGS